MEQAASEHPVKILVVEDNPADVRLMHYALKKESSWHTEMVVVEDGDQAIQYLTQQSSFAQATRPDLVILDLNLPKRDGTEVLQTIRTTEGLEKLPVVILSSSPEDVSERAVQRANLEADCYLMKPADIDDFLALGTVLMRWYNRRMLADAAG
jgi:chemotaxis family two-component system response regulator Rcp1